MSPRNEEQYKQIKDERREKIMYAALKVFAKNGFAATKIGDIAKESGMSNGLMYHYFSSKEEVFHELVEIAVTSSSEALLYAEKMPLSPSHKIKKIAEIILESIALTQDSSFYFLLMEQAMISGMDVEELYAKVEHPNVVMERIIKQGQKDGEIKQGNAKDMATVFFCAIQGLAVSKALQNDFVMPSEDILIGMLIK